ncbi:MAG: aldo/keto reductase, partial [Oscillospiraceae bacterium]|nr:aldo/keto reductase [Oscillospiraceae bacterium]
MRTIPLGKSGLTVPCVAVGCMRINKLSDLEAARFINAAIDAGANFFDHADIYGRGECETIFARAIGMSPKLREKMLIQSKCGIVPGRMFDFSREHILEAVDGSLKRLNTEYLDVLLLHRPDALVEPDEVGEAFDRLKSSGKVRHFGVSNQNPGQMKLLQASLKQPIVANQLQLSIPHAGLVAEGLHVNMQDDTGINRNGSTLDYCRLNEITVQPWSPFQYGFFEG